MADSESARGFLKPASVTIVAHDVNPADGMGRALTKLVSGLLSLGVTITLISRSCTVPAHDQLRWIQVRVPSRPFPLAYAGFFIAGSLLVRRHARGLLHTTGAIVLNRADVSTVHFCHRGLHAMGLSPFPAKPSFAYRTNALVAGWMSRLAERLCYRPRRTRWLVGVSRGLVEELKASYPGMARRVSLIPNAVEQQAFHPDLGARGKVRRSLSVAEDALLALFVGGDWERKGLRFAVEALGTAANWHLVVAGMGDVERYRDLALRAGVEQRTHFLGHLADPGLLYAAADAFVLPTAYETFSLVAFEAAACGLPLLVSRVYGVEDILVEGENGWFIERDPADISQRLMQLGRDLRLRRRMGERSRTAVAACNWESVARSYLHLYQSLAAWPDSAEK
jgi:glycosyltransferase involved in cell wall biosynthesis